MPATSWQEVSGNLPSDFGFVIDVHAHEPETIYVVPIKSDSEHYPARRQAARLSQPDRWKRVGGADQRAAAAGLLRQRAARRHGDRLARFLRRLLRHDGRAGVHARPTRATAGRRSCAICRRSCRSRCRRSREPHPSPPARTTLMIRIVLADPSAQPRPRRRTRCTVDLNGPVTQRSVLDALEAPIPCCAARSAIR